MAEVKIADQDMYGYRTTGTHEPDTRVRVIAGTEIPPDLHSLEPTDDFKDQTLYPDVTSARLSAEEQEQAAKDREKAIAQPSQYNPDQPEDTMPRARTSATAQHSAEDRAKASAASEKRARQQPKRSGRDEAVGEE